MTTTGRARCPQCGALLRRNRLGGATCDPCERVGADPRGKLPAGFYDQAPIVALLRAYDFGPFFRIVRRLMVATGSLAMQAGWMNFECKQHEAARRLWMIGLDLARHADHSWGTDLTLYLLYDMAQQAVHLGRPKEALHLVRVGETAAVSPYPVSASTTGALASIQARAHAAEGDGAACDRALGQAEEHFAAIDPAIVPPWGGHISEAGMSGFHGVAHYTLALASRDTRVAGRAVSLLLHGVDSFGSAYARLRALYLPDLAGAHALAGDLDTAVSVGHQAIDAVTAVSSPRAYERLRTLHTVLEPLHASPGIVELRDRLAITAA